jgi:rhodanese-related sulfurtransferase
MGWDLAGFDCERGSQRVAAGPSPEGKRKALEAARRVAERFKVRFTDAKAIRAWQADASRTLYLLDVRTKEEFERSHAAGSRHAPGGQLVQATDEYVAVRNARIVLIDPERVRAVMTASWLNQMGRDDVYVLDDLAGLPLEGGPRPPVAVKEWPAVSDVTGAVVLDLSSSLRFRQAHIPGAWWGVRARLQEAFSRMGKVGRLVLTSEDGLLAHLAAPEAASLWPDVKVLRGGNAAWRGPTEAGIERATTTLDDVSYKPYDHAADYRTRAQEYLDWEVALVEQIKRDPSIRFRTY